jgi:hypothetical protein
MHAKIKLQEIPELLDAEIIQGDAAENSIEGAYCSDLLSDVMANATEGNALITIQAHKNTVAVASLYGAPCIIICNNRPVPEDMIEAARDERIAIYRCSRNQFQVSGTLYRKMLDS